MQSNMSSNRMFILHAISLPVAPTCFNTVTEDVAQLWHCRFGHLSFKGLQTLQQKGMVEGLPMLKSPSKLCKDCLIGKQHRDSFPMRSSWRASQILQLVHADICGPIKPISNSKKRYLLTCIDDFSQKTWVYFLAEKSEAFTVDLSTNLHANHLTKNLRSSRTSA
uniref:Retrovirus-related Pol polyprotein from transposon TNT 1-94 n=1 Tax=Cajanus cajan TaxID=3821 RepID=A0A151STU8_CAJCA|nr:Retrovirus-related Pol polyprotein from transposon TNT 1-94 [Cajanus cajan]